jgi:hypothetical protein
VAVQVMQVISSVAQTLSPLLYAVFIVVIWFQLRAARDSLREVRQEFLAGGRPVVAVHDEFDHGTRALSIAVENVGQGPAKDIGFVFSRPIQSSDGVVVSGLPLFAIGLTSLSPGARITCYWDDLDDQMTYLRRNGLDGEDFQVTVTYTDLPGAHYWNTWDIQPAIYEGLRAPDRASSPTRPAGRSPEPAQAPPAAAPVQPSDERSAEPERATAGAAPTDGT